MTKWLVLAVDLSLLFNGMLARTYDYANHVRYRWQMDYINLYSCFANPIGPYVVWGTTLLGTALIFGCVLYGRRKGA